MALHRCEHLLGEKDASEQWTLDVLPGCSSSLTTPVVPKRGNGVKSEVTAGTSRIFESVSC